MIPHAPVIGTVEVGCWRDPGEVDAHPDVPTAGLPIPAGREPVAFYVKDGNARSLVAAGSYVVAVPYAVDLDRWPGTPLVCARTDPGPSPVIVETTLAIIGPHDPGLTLLPCRETIAADRAGYRPDVPLVPTHRVVGVHRSFP